MNSRRIHRLSVLTLVVALATVLAPAAASQTGAEMLTTDQLIYGGATVKIQVDVNGEAAVALLGNALDAAAQVAREQAAAMAEGGESPGGPMGKMAIAEPLIAPAMNAIKSVTRVTLLVMQPGESSASEDLTGYYSGLMTERGWMQLVKVRSESGENIAAFVAPGGKGVFAAIRPNARELVVALVTTRRPVGELLGQIVRSGGGHVIAGILGARARAASALAEEKSKQSECSKQEESSSEAK
jgi:hypothetical protein